MIANRSLRFALLALGLDAALAGAVEIGRTSMEIPGGPWELLAAYETQLKLSGASGQHTIPIQNRVFILPARDTPRALLLVAST